MEIEYLYKYLHPDRIDVLRDRRLRFTQPNAFNDPFEWKPYISGLATASEIEDVIQREVPKGIDAEFSKYPGIENLVDRSSLVNPVAELTRIMTSMFAPGLTESIAGVVQTKINEYIGVLSLTAKFTNLLMWAHYASEHKGFVLGFQRRHSWFNRRRSESDEFYFLREVVYHQNRPKDVMTGMSGVEMMLHKGIERAYEEEYRMAAIFDESDTIIDSNPYPIHLFSYPASVLDSVYIGCRASDVLRKELCRIVKGDPELSHVKVYRMTADDREFKLNPRLLP